MRLARMLAMLVALGFATSAWAQETVTCKDGTTSKAGRGACSGHGGVEKAAAKAAPAKATKAEPAKEGKAAPAAAGGEAAMVTCKDGTTSKGGRGACRGHGGVDKGGGKEPAKAATKAEPAAAPAPAPAAAAPAAKAAPAAHHEEERGNTDPTGALARCKDGTYSHAQHHTGACSRHGGVAEWLDKK